MNKDTRIFVMFCLSSYPWRSALMVAFLVLSGLAEGVGLMGLVPMLELAMADSGAEFSPLAKITVEAYGYLGLSPKIGVMLAVIVVMLTIKALFMWMAMVQVGYTITYVMTDLRLDLLKHIMEAEWEFFTRQPAGRFLHSIGADISKTASAFQQVCVLIAGMISVIVYTALATLVSWQVVLFGAVFSVGLMFSLQSLIDKSRQANKEYIVFLRSLSVRLTEALNGIKPIKSMARENNVWSLLRSEIEGLDRTQKTQVMAKWTLSVIQEPLIVGVLATGLYFAMTYSDQPFSAIIILAFLFYRSMMRAAVIQRNYQAMVSGEAAYWSYKDTLEQSVTHKERWSTDSKEKPSLSKSLEFHNVSFNFGNTVVLDQVSVGISAGECIALVGPSGAGKTTMLDLMIGLYQPKSGEITVDGIALNSVSPWHWRRAIGYVPQDTFLFNETVYSNVILGDADISRDECESILKLAGAWDFVSQYSDGMDTLVGEKGTKLSGGQRQRISIARALARRPKLLLLDEITSGLDVDAELAICQTMFNLKGEVTIVTVSHRPAMVRIADSVYSLSGGKLEGVAPVAHQSRSG